MEIAKVKVTGTRAETIKALDIPQGIVGTTVSFEFGPEWAGLTKNVVFVGAKDVEVLSIQDSVYLPPEVVSAPNIIVKVGIVGVDTNEKMVIPTLWADLGTVKPGAPVGMGYEPTLPIWAQLMGMIGDLRGLNTADKSNLVAAINEAMSKSGTAGGYYTPVVTQTTTNTMKIAFVPSVATMPAVEPVTITLPGSDSGQNPTVEPMEDDIPKVFITGVKPTTKDDVLAEMQYISKTDNFHAYLEIKCQGTSSMSYPKKNFTVKLYSDEARETKLKKSFKDWNHNGNKYVLKANYIDHSHARNIVSARLWNEVVKSRPDYDTLPVEMRTSPRNGVVDGFPVKVYYNGTYEGVYTWNIGKDDWMWNMDEDNPNHVLLCAETNTDGNYRATPCNFRALWSGVDETDWSVEVGTNSAALKTSLNNLIQFVMDNDGDDFRNGISNHLDIQSAIDYYIFQYEVCGLDGLAKNMLLATYDGTKWICGAYDMDSTFGLWWTGASFVSATYACPENYQEQFSLLWERIESNFLPELKVRQTELRKTVLSYSNMVTHFERFMDTIGNDLYAEDLTVYGGIPSGSTNNIKQIRNYIRDRQAYVDAEFAAMSNPVACTGISLDADTLTFTAEGIQTLTPTVTPDGCTDTVIWESDNTSVATVSDGAVTAIANGSATITAKCGEYSASCAVSVSGIAEPIPCTGISLDKAKLTFVGEGTQTIAATVEPADTTDTIVWSSSNEKVATVSGGVVTAKANGSTIISAVCGEHSASCEVDITGFPENLLATVAWHVGEVSETTGEVNTDVTQAMYTDFIDIGDYVGTVMKMTCDGSHYAYSRVVLYDENLAFINVAKKDSLFLIPDNAKYARVSIYGGSGKIATLYGDTVNQWDVLTIEEGSYVGGVYDPTDTNSCHIKVPVESGLKFAVYGKWGAFTINSENEVTQTSSDPSGGVEITPADGDVYIAHCTNDGNESNTVANWLRKVGESVVT